MQKILFTLVSQLFILLVFSNFAFSQDCSPPEVIFNKNAKNMFTEEQEIYLGEAMAERTRRNYRVINDPELTDYLDKIGNRLTKHLPPTAIKFKFHVVDLPDANAFISAGGNVYVTRKLIGFVKNEDELAGVIAHELGHGIVRHSAITMTKYFEELLGVKKLGNRKDVFDKYNQYLEKFRTKRVRFNRNHSSKEQLEADEIGLYSMVAAGYNGRGLAEFWDRFTELDGKAGNWFTDFIGGAKLTQKRYRRMLGAMKKIPAGCLENASSNSEEFQQWQAFVVNYSGLGGRESLTALLDKKKLTPPLQAEINHLQFSPNGKYILAQDDSGINVLSRDPFSFLFRIEAPEVKPASFTADSKHIIFYNTGLRVQKWSVAEKRAVSITETYIRRPCWQSEISPNAKMIACYDFSWNLNIFDVETNELIYKKKNFYRPSYGEYLSWSFILSLSDESELPLLNMQFSPDSKYLLAGRKFNGKGGYYSFGRSESIGVDISAKKQFKLNNNLKRLIYAAFTFYSNDKIIGQYGKDGKKSGIFSFPKGDRVEEFFLRGESFSKSTKGDYLLVRPVTNAPVGVYDLKAKKFVVANKKSAFDIYGKNFIAERRTGEIGLYEIEKGGLIGKVELPNNDFGTLRATALSPDGKWLAISEKSRGALWNLESGERVFHIRGFRGGYFSEDGVMYSDFPKNKQMKRMVAVMNPAERTISQGDKIENNNTRQFGSYLVSFKSNNLKKESSKNKKKDNKKKDKDKDKDVEFERAGFRNVTMTVRSATTGLELWAREFEDERPRFSLNKVYNTLTLAWRLSTKSAKNIIKNDQKLERKLSKMKDKAGDYLLQILQPQTGKVIGQVLIETGEGSFDIDNLTVAGDWLIIEDTRNRVLLYSISQDNIIHRFFGDKSAVSPENNLIAVENEPGRLTIYDLNSGEPKEKLQFTSRIAFVRFNGNGKNLFVLTADQKTFLFDAKALNNSRLATL